MNSELTEKLFRAAHEIALDLASLNIQRGRDHALPGYIEWRRVCNLSVNEDFDELSSDISSADVRNSLKQLYGHPGNINSQFSINVKCSVLHGNMLFSCSIFDNVYYYFHKHMKTTSYLIKVNVTMLSLCY